MNYNVTLKGDPPFKLSLPVCKIPGTKNNIIAFDITGQTALICRISGALERILPEFDVVLCPEAKAMPYAHEIARLRNKDYFVLRKSPKLYMENPQSVSVSSITTEQEQKLWWCTEKTKALKGKKVLVFDDVISTGKTLDALYSFCQTSECIVTATACVFIEGESLGKGYASLGFLPILTDEQTEKLI